MTGPLLTYSHFPLNTLWSDADTEIAGEGRKYHSYVWPFIRMESAYLITAQWHPQDYLATKEALKFIFLPNGV